MDNETKSTLWPPPLVLDIFTGFQKSQALFVTTELQLYDLLAIHQNGMTANEIASKKKLNLDATERILDYATGLKLIKKDFKSESKTAIYSNYPEIAEVLQSSKPNNMVAAIKYASRIQYPLYQHLITMIKSGKNTETYKKAFGFEVTTEICEHLYEFDKDYSETFLQFMHQLSSITSPGVAKAFDLSPFCEICDLGGGSGALAYALASEYPDATVTVFDLATAVEAAQKITPDKTERQKVKFVSGDFFQDEFPPASLYTFARTIQDWPDEKVHQLLDKTFKSLESGGAILIAELLMNETKTGPLYPLGANVQMMIERSGRQRTETEYRLLLEKHGFVDFECKFVEGYSSYHAIIAKKP
ncbi:acetylserotonin O-methyltransferase-like [Antedon mediterranea]|uniref:acetylserotonin O-methyltransferase-like n=1 Tax=Antedon mediterranea TaxID=105859 RepID=UPI003AF4E6E0